MVYILQVSRPLDLIIPQKNWSLKDQPQKYVIDSPSFAKYPEAWNTKYIDVILCMYVGICLWYACLRNSFLCITSAYNLSASGQYMVGTLCYFLVLRSFAIVISNVSRVRTTPSVSHLQYRTCRFGLTLKFPHIKLNENKAQKRFGLFEGPARSFPTHNKQAGKRIFTILTK